MPTFVIDSEKISNNKTIYSNSFNENIKLKSEYQSNLSKLVKYDKNTQDEQYYFAKYNKIFYYSKYPDNFISCYMELSLLNSLTFNYPGSNDFGIDLSKLQYKVVYNGRY